MKPKRTSKDEMKIQMKTEMKMKVQMKMQMRGQMKGQIFETMSFLILAIAIIGVIIVMRIYLVGGAGSSFVNIIERQTDEGFRAGANSVLYSTNERTGKTMLELVGIAAYIGNNSIDLGPTVGTVNLADDLTWRFDALYGKGRWHVEVKYPDIIPDIQIAMVLDTSSSMCYSTPILAQKMPQLIDQIRSSGKKVSFTIYMLPGSVRCCNGFSLDCSSFSETPYFHCRGIESIQGECAAKLPSGLAVQTDEDYGDGMACAIQAGPLEGWKKGSVKLVIGSSDELSLGSECGGQNICCPSVSSYPGAAVSGQNAINASLSKQVPLYLIQAIDYINQSSKNCGSICFYDDNGQQYTAPLDQPQCACTDVVTQFQQGLANSTGGQYYNLNDISGSDIIDKIQSIINGLKQDRVPDLEIGSPIPLTNTRVVNIPVPISLTGTYTTATITEWS